MVVEEVVSLLSPKRDNLSSVLFRVDPNRYTSVLVSTRLGRHLFLIWILLMAKKNLL